MEKRQTCKNQVNMLVIFVLVLLCHQSTDDQTREITGVCHFIKCSPSSQMTDTVGRIGLPTEAHTTTDYSSLGDDFGRPPEA